MLSDFYDEVNILINDIIEQRITKNDASKRIRDLKTKYGNDIFPGIHFEKEAKPWNKDYLLKLKDKNITGACSEEFILHMAEVSEDIVLRKKRIIVSAVVSVIVVIFIIVLFLLGINKQPETYDISAIDFMFYEDVVMVEENNTLSDTTKLLDN